MLAKRANHRLWLGVSCLLVFTLACALSPSPTATQSEPSAVSTAAVAPATRTPTPSPAIQELPSRTHAAPATRCKGLNGSIELRVPLEVAAIEGLELFADGRIPFSVTAPQEPYTVEGAGRITYQDSVVEDDSTYEVTLEGDVTIDGTCTGSAGSETLQLKVTMSGWTSVRIFAPGSPVLEGTIEGGRTVDATFPLEEGAAVEREDWTLILHLQ